MSAVTTLREDFAADELRRLARASRDAGQSRRLLALATIYDGSRRTAAARVGAVGLQTVRNWAVVFNAHGPAGLIGAGQDAQAQPQAAPSARRHY